MVDPDLPDALSKPAVDKLGHSPPYPEHGYLAAAQDSEYAVHAAVAASPAAGKQVP